MKRCSVSIGRITLKQQQKKRPVRKSKASSKFSNSLAGSDAFVSNVDDIDSSIEILDHSQDLSWELVEGGIWNETNKQIIKEARMSSGKAGTSIQLWFLELALFSPRIKERITIFRRELLNSRRENDNSRLSLP